MNYEIVNTEILPNGNLKITYSEDGVQGIKEVEKEKIHNITCGCKM